MVASLTWTSWEKGLLTAVVVCSSPTTFKPNPGGPGYSNSGTYADGSAQVPFDGGMSLVLAASGIGYAAKKLKRKK